MIFAVPIAADIAGNMKRASAQVLRDRDWGTTLAFLVCLMLLVQILFIFFLSARAVSHLLTDSAAIQLEVLPSASEADVQQLYAALQVHPAVRSVTFLSKQQVYDKQKQLHPEDIAFLEQYNFSNPFPDIFSVTLTSLDAYDRLASDIRSNRWKSVVDPAFLTASADHEAEIRTLLDVTRAVHTLSVIFMVIACLVLGCAVFEWAKRTSDSRGHELLLRHLMGASPTQVLLPFTIEMTILLIAAVIIAAVAVTGFILLFPLMLPAFVVETPFQTFKTAFVPLLWTVFPLFVFLQILCMPFLAYAGAAVTARVSLPKSFILFP